MTSCGCLQPENKLYNYYQPFPQEGLLADHMNQDKSNLAKLIPNHSGELYIYIVATVKNDRGNFLQTGCGPNFQGGSITLNTCKHRMRTFKTASDWKTKWIAGVSTSTAGNGHNALIYLMQIGKAFDSMKALWESNYLTDTAKLAKAAHRDRFGDVFAPKGECNDPYDSKNYLKPQNDHCHEPGNLWHKDICYYQGCSGRQPALLAGDIKNSFLWNKPLIYFSEKVYRGQRKNQLREFFELLKEYY